jgi:L-aspartate oxidase
MNITDVLIIGSGIAGAAAALRVAQQSTYRVILLTRASDPHESNTRWAQGGIIHRNGADDAEVLYGDILTAGAGATLPQAAHILAHEGPLRLERLLLEQGLVAFDRHADGTLMYGQEAAHSRRRILHVGDHTGHSIMQGLIAAVRAHPRIELITNATAVDLITYPHHSQDPLHTYAPVTCHGAYVFDRDAQQVHRIIAKTTVLATGGLGRIYRHTTNPVGSRGDGLAMAHRAGARIINAEYIQFHPTTLATPSSQGFLISEAVRGEGGILLTPDGEPFMHRYDPQWRDLAPRDVVARAIHAEMESNGYPYVLLDIASHLPATQIRERFPTIYAECLRAGIDMTSEPIPVMPAVHYSCGGIAVTCDGESTIQHLYAVGEVACNGLHGANRLASTSLLEGLVYGERAAEHLMGILPYLTVPDPANTPRWDESNLTHESDPALIQGDMQTIQNIMWHYVGLVRSGERLSRAIRELRHLQNEIESFYRKTRLSDGLIGLRNAVEVGLIVAQSARHNRQSRGCHYRTDTDVGHTNSQS